MNTKIAGSILAAIEQVNCKKLWVKPEVEIISNDLIKGGRLTSIEEGSTIGGVHGVS